MWTIATATRVESINMTDDLKHSASFDDIGLTNESDNESPLDGIFETTAPHVESSTEIADKWRSFMTEQDVQNERGSSKWMVFIGTLVLFVLLGGIDRIWDTLFALVPVILFHELGHLLAMKLCGYTDLSVFFLPLFGAAAMGKEIEPSQTKRAFVALMGPLPGFVLGIVLMITTDTREGLLNTIVQYLFILNLFNLLPISPMDGGRIVEAIIISRSTVAGKLFAFMGPAVLGLLALALEDVVLGVFAFSMVFSAFKEVQLLGLVGEIKKQGIELSSGTPEKVPDDVFVVLLNRIRDKFKNLGDRDIAKYLGLLVNRLGIVKSSSLAVFGMTSAFVLTILFGLGGFIISMNVSSQADPEYQGKRVSEWAALLPLRGTKEGEKAEEVLRQALRENDSVIKDSTVYTIGELRHNGVAAVPLLVDSLEEHLGLSGDTASIQPDDIHIQSVIEAIAKIGPEAALQSPNVHQVLATALSHPSWSVRHIAAIGLGAIGPTASVVYPKLQKALAAEQDDYVREAMQQTVLQLMGYVNADTSASKADAGQATISVSK